MAYSKKDDCLSTTGNHVYYQFRKFIHAVMWQWHRQLVNTSLKPKLQWMVFITGARKFSSFYIDAGAWEHGWVEFIDLIRRSILWQPKCIKIVLVGGCYVMMSGKITISFFFFIFIVSSKKGVLRHSSPKDKYFWTFFLLILLVSFLFSDFVLPRKRELHASLSCLLWGVRTCKGLFLFSSV